MNFHEVSDAMEKDAWINLYWHLVDQHGSYIGKGPFEDPQYHGKLIALLRKVGMNEEANELEMVRISDDDLRYGKTPLSTTFRIGDVLKQSREKDQSFKAAMDAYKRNLEDISEKVHGHIISSGWEKELDGQYELRYPEGEADLHRLAKRMGYSLSGKFIPGDSRRPGWKIFSLHDAQGNAAASGKLEDIESFLGRISS